MVDANAGGIVRTSEDARFGWQRAVHEFPRHSVCSDISAVDLDAARAAVGIDAAKPDVMFA
jgi:hypothetical protein